MSIQSVLKSTVAALAIATAAPLFAQGTPIDAAAFHALVAQGPVADAATIVRLADQAGLPGKALVERSPVEAISAQYEQNRQDALAADVFGSPAYVLNGETFWGQDRLELLGDALKSGRAPYSSKVS